MNKAAPASARSAREAGFTLIELLVSLTILAAILGLLAGALSTLSKNWVASAERIETLDMVARAGDVLRRDAAGMQRIVALSGKTPRYLFRGTDTRLSFVTLEPPYPSAAGPYFVEYAVARNGSDAELTRSRARYQHGLESFPGATPANRVVLAQGHYRYHFAYADRSGKTGAWLSSWTDPTRLPELIRLQIFDVARNTPVAPPFVVPLRADAELSCLSQKSEVCSPKSGGMLKAAAESAEDDPKNRYRK